MLNLYHEDYSSQTSQTDIGDIEQDEIVENEKKVNNDRNCDLNTILCDKALKNELMRSLAAKMFLSAVLLVIEMLQFE